MQNKEVPLTPGYGPGKTLRQARTDLKLSQDDVALQLHLAPRQIIALETDDYDSLPEPTYVRGYLRAYAMLLGLKPEPILESYAQLMPPQKMPSGQKVNLGVDEETSSKEPHIKLASYVVAALVIGLTVAWWQSYEPTPRLPSEDVAAVPDEALPAPAESPQMGQRALSESMATATPPPSPITARPSAPALPATPPAPPVAVTSVPPPPAPAPAPAPFSASAPVAPASPSAPTAAADTEIPTAARAQIVLRTEQDSWAEVRDAQDSRLLYENVPAGRTVKIEGEAPLSVFVGNVDGVKVEYNGRPYDISRYKRGMVARFTLGASPPAAVPAAADAPTP